MRQLLKRVFQLAVPAGGLGIVALVALHHVTQVLASGPLFYISDRVLKEQIAPVSAQRILAALVRR